MVKVNCLNKISKAGMKLFSDNYEIVDDFAQADAALDYLIIESTFGSADRGNKPYSHLDLNSVFYLCDVLYQQGTLTDRTQVYLTHINQEQDFIHEEMVAECEKRKTPYKVTVAYDGLQMADYKK